MNYDYDLDEQQKAQNPCPKCHGKDTTHCCYAIDQDDGLNFNGDVPYTTELPEGWVQCSKDKRHKFCSWHREIMIEHYGVLDLDAHCPGCFPGVQFVEY